MLFPIQASTSPSGRPETSPIAVMKSPARTIKAQHDAFHIISKDSVKLMELEDLARKYGSISFLGGRDI